MRCVHCIAPSYISCPRVHYHHCVSQELEALKKQKVAEEQRAKETLASELDRLDREWASKAALKVSLRPGLLILAFSILPLNMKGCSVFAVISGQGGYGGS